MTATLEDVQAIEINKWGSLNTTASPSRLPEGQSPDNQNVWTDEKPGSVITANGYTLLGTNPSGNPNTFLINFFKTSDGSQTVILSDGTTVWKTTDYITFTVITTGLSNFFQLRGMVIRGKLWLTNGNDSVMTYDGTTLTLLNGAGGTPNVPLAKYISYHDERVWLYGISLDPSSLRFSALTDSSGTEIMPDNSGAWSTDNEIQVSEGDADIGTGLFLYRGYLYASKSFSIWRIVGYDEYNYTRVKTRSSTGTRFQESVQELDNLVHFIGVDGFYTFDGEESKRISDIIDPASSESGVFAFRNLQQPLVNNNFSNISETSDWSTGTVPANLSTADDRLTLIPVDTSQADFQAGATQTNVDLVTTPGSILMSHASSGQSSLNLALGQAVSITGSSVIGTASFLTDGGLTSIAGMFSLGLMTINLSSSSIQTARIILRSLAVESGNKLFFYRDGVLVTPTSISGAPYVINGDGSVTLTDAITNPIGPTRDVTFNFTAFTASQISLRTGLPGAGTTKVQMTEFQVFATAFNTTGKFVSKTLDYTVTPQSFGSLAAAETLNGGTISYFTQSSDDGAVWDSEVSVSNGGAITSTLRRYLRWGANFVSTGLATPSIDYLFVGGTYLSPVIDTGGNINQWGIFQLVQDKGGQTINAFYRAGPSSAAVLASAWTLIVPGAVIGAAVTDTFIQVRFSLGTASASAVLFITSFTLNWVVGTTSGVNTLQNVASIVILNRYWLAAATLGSDANDVIIVRGKATAQSPWQKKDFAMLSFARFHDYYIAGSSTDGSIYRLEYGFSKNGSAMDSYFETGDFTKSGFLMQLYEVIVNLDRSGPYTLSIGVSTDGGITFTEKTVDLTRATLTTNLSFIKKLNINFMADKFRLRFRINAADHPFSVDSVQVYYRLLPERGSLN